MKNSKRIIIFCPWLVRKQTVHSRWHLQQWRERTGRGVDCRDGGMLPHIPLTPGIYMKLHIKMAKTLSYTIGSVVPLDHQVMESLFKQCSDSVALIV